MDTLRNPTPGLNGFQLPAPDAPRAEWEEAFARMRTVKLTYPQIHQGYSASLSGDGSFGDIVILRAWCEEEGILPADVAAEAILVRMSPVIDALFDRPDLSHAEQKAIALRDLEVRYDVLQFIGAAPWEGVAAS